MVSKVFEKLVNNRTVDHLEKFGLFSDFQYGFRSSRATADLLTVASDRIARVFKRSGATRAVALDISKAFDRVWDAAILHKLKSNEISGQIFGHISSFPSNRRLRWFWMGSLHKNIQLMLEFLKAPYLVLHFSYYTLMTFLMMLSVIFLSMLMILLSILNVIRHLICGNNLNSELESDLRDTVDWGKKWLVDFDVGETQLVSFDWSNNVKMDGCVLEENHHLSRYQG